MIDYPLSPALNDTVTAPNGVVWTWNGSAWAYQSVPGGGGDGGSGFTFIQDTAPTPVKAGDTWFNNSTGPTGGVSYLAMDDGTGALIWVQFSPGSAAPTVPTPTWKSFVPVVTASVTSPVLGSAPNVYGMFIEDGPTIHWRCYIDAEGSGISAGSGSYFVSLPLPTVYQQMVGYGWMYGAQGFKPVVVDGNVGRIIMTTTGGYLSNAEGFTAGGHVLAISGTYQI